MQTIKCDVETTKAINGKIFFTDGQNFFESGNMQSDEYAHNGNYSCKFTRDCQYGLNYKISNLKKGEVIKAGAWFLRNNTTLDGDVSVVATCGDKFYKGSFAKLQCNNTWQYSEIEFELPESISKKDTLMFYIWNNSQDNVYVDDFSVTRNNYLKFF